MSAELSQVAAVLPLPTADALRAEWALGDGGGTAGASATGASNFSKLIADGIDRVNQNLARADAVVAQAAVDGSQPPHQVMLALEEARLSFQLALQVRTKLLEAYQELMRMQV